MNVGWLTEEWSQLLVFAAATRGTTRPTATLVHIIGEPWGVPTQYVAERRGASVVAHPWPNPLPETVEIALRRDTVPWPSTTADIRNLAVTGLVDVGPISVTTRAAATAFVIELYPLPLLEHFELIANGHEAEARFLAGLGE